MQIFLEGNGDKSECRDKNVTCQHCHWHRHLLNLFTKSSSVFFSRPLHGQSSSFWWKLADVALIWNSETIRSELIVSSQWLIEYCQRAPAYSLPYLSHPLLTMRHTHIHLHIGAAQWLVNCRWHASLKTNTLTQLVHSLSNKQCETKSSLIYTEKQLFMLTQFFLNASENQYPVTWN